jgi:hypothetical protein
VAILRPLVAACGRRHTAAFSRLGFDWNTIRATHLALGLEIFLETGVQRPTGLFRSSKPDKVAQRNIDAATKSCERLAAQRFPTGYATSVCAVVSKVIDSLAAGYPFSIGHLLEFESRRRILFEFSKLDRGLVWLRARG